MLTSTTHAYGARGDDEWLDRRSSSSRRSPLRSDRRNSELIDDQYDQWRADGSSGRIESMNQAYRCCSCLPAGAWPAPQSRGDNLQRRAQLLRVASISVARSLRGIPSSTRTRLYCRTARNSRSEPEARYITMSAETTKTGSGLATISVALPEVSGAVLRGAVAA